MVTLEERLKDPDYKSWVKAALCLQVVKEGLETFVDDKSKELHQNVLSHVPAGHRICPAACTDPLKKIRKCCSDCKHILTLLESYCVGTFTFQKDQYNNTEVADWHTEPWQMAKLYMNRGQAKTSKRASQTDLSGILNFMGLCSVPRKDVQNHANIDEVRKERNAILHTSNMLLTDADFLQKTKPMLDLLNDPKILATPAAQTAATRIEEVKNKSFEIHLDDETVAIKAKVTENRILMDDLSTKVAELEKLERNTVRVTENCRAETEKQQEAITSVVDGIKEVKQRYEELGVLCNAVQTAHIEDNQQLRNIVEHHKSDLNHLHGRISKLKDLESRFGRLEVNVREHDLKINELQEETCKLKTLGIQERITQSDNPDDDQITDYDFTMRVDESDDEENSLRMVRLIKYYPVLKSEMDWLETRRIAAALLDKDSARGLVHEKQRRMAVDMLLKYVLRTEATMLFFNLLKDYWKPSDEIRELLKQLEATAEDVEAYSCIKVHDTPQWNFIDDDRKELRFTIKDFTTIDTLNNWFLSKFFFRVLEHDDVIDYLSLNLGVGVDHLFDTMNKCSKSIMRCFCDTLESYCSYMCKVVGRLDLKKKYCDLASEVEEDGRFQRFVSRPLRRLFSYCTHLGFTVERTEVGSLVLYLRADTESAWEELKHKCKSGDIVEMLCTFDTDDQTRKTCFEEGDCIRITIYSVRDKSGVPKAILRLDTQDRLNDDGSEANPIKRNMDILCEELEICDSLIEDLKGQTLVPDDIIELLEGQHTRASKIRCLMENISSPEKGFRVLQDYVKRCNSYLFAQLELSTEKYRNTNVFFTCEAMLEANTSDELVDDKLEANPIKRNMDILCEELEICDSLIEELKEQKLVADNIRKLLEEQRARASKIRCLMENISPPEKGFKALKDYVRRCNTYLLEQLEINSEECRKTVFYTAYVSASGRVRLQWVVKNRKFYDTELKECKLPYTGSHEVMPQSNLDQVLAIQHIDSEDMEHHTMKTLVGPKPGKPVIEDVTSESVTIHWESQTTLGDSNFYQIRYKEKGKKQWEYPEKESMTIRNLKAHTAYTFQVRAVPYDGEAKFILESDEILTDTSMASRLLRHSTKLMSGHPEIYQLHTTVEYISGFFPYHTQRKFELGYSPIRNLEEKNILLLGETWSGNITMVDAITNYVTGVTFKDSYRVRLTEQMEKFVQIEGRGSKRYRARHRLPDEMDMYTETLLYTINPEEGSRLKFRLNIVDKPGFDMSLPSALDLVERLFSERCGPEKVDAVCFLIEAPTDFWSQSQKSVIEKIDQEFGPLANIDVCTLITFSDFIKPSIAALKNTGLLNENCYIFNNNCLFESQTNVSSELWDINKRSFQQFFTWLERLPTHTSPHYSPHYLI